MVDRHQAHSASFQRKRSPHAWPITRTQPERVVAKLVSDPNPNKPLTHDRIDRVLRGEFKGADFPDIPHLVEHIFSDCTLGFSPKQVLADLQSLGHRLYTPEGQWNLDLFAPRGFGTTGQEGACANLFNVVGASIAILAELPLKRLWRQFSTEALPGIRAIRQPDVALFDNSVHGFPMSPESVLQRSIERKQVRRYEHHTFQNLRSTCQVKSRSSTRAVNSARKELSQDAYFTFSTQCNRRYVLSISFCDVSAGLSLFDRAGGIHSESFDINMEPVRFIRLIAGLALTDNVVIGYDPTINLDSDGRPRLIDVGANQYEIVNTEFISDMVRGRGTVCFRARREGVEYAIKDAWMDTALPHSEADMLRAATGVTGIPILVEELVLRINGRTDSTSWPRECIPMSHKSMDSLMKLEVREHHRLVLMPFASPLITFKSKIELLTILHDAIKSHRDLVVQKQILHRDISIRNIMIHRVTEPESINFKEQSIALLGHSTIYSRLPEKNFDNQPSTSSTQSSSSVSHQTSSPVQDVTDIPEVSESPPTSPSVSSSSASYLPTPPVPVTPGDRHPSLPPNPPSTSDLYMTTCNVSRGILIDYDYSSYLSELMEEVAGHRTGTLPFMAINLLENGGDSKVSHVPLYDLQSFFFVFIWMCILYEGPQIPRAEMPEELQHWVGHSMNTIATFKRGQILSERSFMKSLAAQFTSHFQDLRDFANKFREAVLFDEQASPDDLKVDWKTNVEPHNEVIRLFDSELERQKQLLQARLTHQQTQQEQASEADENTRPRRSSRGVAADVAKLVNDQLRRQRRRTAQ